MVIAPMIRPLALALSLFLAAPPLIAGTIFVDANLTTGADDGSSWANALQGPTGLKRATLIAQSGDRIFVARGKYRPALGSSRNASITLVDGVEIYGGFLGFESSPSERPPFGSVSSIIDGDLNGDDDQGHFSDNSYHCVRGGTGGPTTLLDGFVIRGGRADGYASDHNAQGGGLLIWNGKPRIRNCRFTHNFAKEGGAALVRASYIYSASWVVFADCIFEKNISVGKGGGVSIISAKPTAPTLERCRFEKNKGYRGGALNVSFAVEARNCTFIDNVARWGDGGAVYAEKDWPNTFSNCTFVGNRSLGSPVGGAYLVPSTGSTHNPIRNCIFWNNMGADGSHGTGNQLNALVQAVYSLVEGGHPGEGNSAADPLFVDLVGRDLHLTATSPAIDAGSSRSMPLDSLDLDHAPRRVDDPSALDTGKGPAPIVDMGAYEYAIGVSDPYCLAVANSTGVPSILAATGSLTISDNDVNLVVLGLPQGEPAMMLMAATTWHAPLGNGLLCLGTPQVRFDGQILNSGPTGSVSLSPDLTNLPQGTVVQPGETWTFQLWHRDGSSSNLSSSLSLTWL